jgi:tetratricopeptide (TPR) repeat protein
MKKYLLLSLLLFACVGSLFAQRTLEKKETTEGMSIFVDKDPTVDNAGGGQAGAIISSPINIELHFSSNVDRTVDVYKTEERGDLRYYSLRFIVGRYRGASYNNRILEVSAPGFAPLKFPIELQASESKSFEIFDPNATVGVGCYFEHLNKGNNFFTNTQYEDAKTEYNLALECSDVPEDNDLRTKIDNAGTAFDCKQAADSYFNAGQYVEAKHEYEKLRGLNPNDKYPAERIADCDMRSPNLARTISVIVTDENGNNLSDVAFSADKYKVDKKGNLVLKNDKPQKEKGFEQATTNNNDGVYSVTVKNVNQTLALRKYIDGKKELYDEVQIPANTDVMEIKLIKIRMTSVEKWNSGFGLGKSVLEELGKSLK